MKCAFTYPSRSIPHFAFYEALIDNKRVTLTIWRPFFRTVMRYSHIVELISPTAVPVVSAHTVPVAKAYLRKYGKVSKEACEIRFGTSRL